MSVPGTFKHRPPTPVRILTNQAGAFAAAAVRAGALTAECWQMGECSIIAAREPYRGVYRWHVSVAHPTRYPTWDELKTAAYGIPTVKLPAGRTFAQLLGNPAATEAGWVDVHENCLHLFEIDDPLE